MHGPCTAWLLVPLPGCVLLLGTPPHQARVKPISGLQHTDANAGNGWEHRCQALLHGQTAPEPTASQAYCRQATAYKTCLMGKHRSLRSGTPPAAVHCSAQIYTQSCHHQEVMAQKRWRCSHPSVSAVHPALGGLTRHTISSAGRSRPR